MILANKITEERKKNGWSQEELANQLGVSRQAVSKWESAGAVPDAYKEYQGRWVKNAYDPQFTVDGKYDEKAAQAAETLDIYMYDDEGSQPGIQDREARAQLSALLAYGQTRIVLSVG